MGRFALALQGIRTNTRPMPPAPSHCRQAPAGTGRRAAAPPWRTAPWRRRRLPPNANMARRRWAHAGIWHGPCIVNEATFTEPATCPIPPALLPPPARLPPCLAALPAWPRR
jgi:hypothetical protein